MRWQSLPLLVAGFLFALVANARADWPAYGDTLYRYYQPSPGAQIVSDGAGGVFVGLHVILSSSDNLIPSHFAADGSRVGVWNTHIESRFDFALDGNGGMYAPEFPNYSTGDLSIDHWTAAGVLDPSWTGGRARVVDGSLGLGVIQEESVASDDSGGVYVTCNFNDQHLLAWRVLADGSFAGGWPPEGAPIRDVFGESVVFHTTVPDGTGGLLAGVMGITSGTNYFMRAFRERPNGTRKWATLVSTDHTAGGPVLGLVHADGDHVFYCWGNDVSSTTREVRLQCLELVNGARVSAWPATGMLIAQGHPDSLAVRLMSDGGTGAYVVWSRPGSIRAVRVDSTGTLVTGWPVPGNSLVDTGAMLPTDALPAIGTASASSHGLMYVWSDPRSPSMRVRWRMPDGSVDPGHPDSGTLLPTSPHGRVISALFGDGAFVVAGDYTWPNQSEFNTFLLNRIDASPTAVEPSRLGLGSMRVRAYPNPATHELSLALTLRDDAPARAELIDVAGHRVRTLELAGTGARGARFDRLEALPSGVYFVRVSQRGATATTRVALVH